MGRDGLRRSRVSRLERTTLVAPVPPSDAETPATRGRDASAFGDEQGLKGRLTYGSRDVPASGRVRDEDQIPWLDSTPRSVADLDLECSSQHHDPLPCRSRVGLTVEAIAAKEGHMSAGRQQSSNQHRRDTVSHLPTVEGNNVVFES